MDYDNVFTVRGKDYAYAVSTYPDALSEEFMIAAQMCDAKSGMKVVNVPGACVDISKYLQKDVQYIAYETNAVFAELSGLPTCSWSSIPCENSSVDRVISLASLHHATNEERTTFYYEARRILKDDGYLIIGDVYAKSDQAGWLNTFVNEWNSVGHAGKFWDLDDVALIESCGFSVNPVLQTYRWNFESRDAMIDFCRRLFGLDLASDYVIYSGLKTYLNASDTGFEWSLLYFIAKADQTRVLFP